MTDTEIQSSTTDVAYTARCTTSSQTPFGAEVATLCVTIVLIIRGLVLGVPTKHFRVFHNSVSTVPDAPGRAQTASLVAHLGDHLQAKCP